MQDKRGRKLFSRGVWAPAETIDGLRGELVAERSTEGYAKRTVAAAARRDKIQTAYVEDFAGAVAHFLGFHPTHRELADRLAEATAGVTPSRVT